MTNINDEMKAYADAAVATAKQSYGIDLDYSEQSIVKLDNLLGLVYWDFFNRSKKEREKGDLSNAATLWGGYLGETMRLKWGGTWISRGSERLVSIKKIEFSPISIVYQKIKKDPDCSVKDYLNKLEEAIILSPIASKQAEDSVGNNGKFDVGKFKRLMLVDKLKTRVENHKDRVYGLAGLGLIVLFTVLLLNGIRNDGSLLSLFFSPTRSSPNFTIKNTLAVATLTSRPVHVELPTLNPYFTPYSTLRIDPTNTPVNTATPTGVKVPIVPARTPTSLISPTPTIFKSATAPPIVLPTPTSTKRPPTATLPQPTATEAIPVVIDSCEVDPSSVPVNNNVTLTFIVHFSPPTANMGFKVEFDPAYPDQVGCIGNDNDGDGLAFCDGSSGTLPESATVHVTFITSVGNCVASYKSR